MELDIFTYQRIFDHVLRDGDLREVKLMLTCKWLYHNLTIREIPFMDGGWRQTWLESYSLRNVEKFHWWGDDDIDTVGHFKKLRKLCLCGVSVFQDEMDRLDLEVLRVYGIRTFEDLSHMKNLRSLHLSNDSVPFWEFSDQKLLEKLTNLEELFVERTDVDDLNHLRNLRKLTICSAPYIGNGGVRNLNLEELDVDDTEITDVSHMTNLRKLTVREDCPLTQECIDRLNLEVLTMMDPDGYRLGHMTNLRSLVIMGDFDQEGISGINVRKLCLYDCPSIKDVNHMSKLEELTVGGSCGVDDEGIKKVNLRILSCNYIPGITTVNHMSRLERLSARGNSGIDNEGIKRVNLRWLNISGNEKISEYGHMTRLIEVVNE